MLQQQTHIVKYVLQNTQTAQHLRKWFQTSVNWRPEYQWWFPLRFMSYGMRQHTNWCLLLEKNYIYRLQSDLKKWSAQGKGDRSLYVTSNQCIPLKNTHGWNAVVFCACEITQLLSAVFYMVRAVRKFEFGFVIRAKKRVTQLQRLMLFTEFICFPLSVASSVKALYTRCAGRLLHLQ